MTCTFLCVLFSITKAQNTADSLWQKGEYEQAALAYEYQLYRLENRDLLNHLLLQKTWCYKALGQFDKAQKTMSRMDLSLALSDSTRYVLLYESALCAYLNKSYAEVVSFTAQTKYFVKDSTISNKILFLEILSLNELKRWTEAKKVFYRYALHNNISAKIVDSLYLFEKNPKLKKPEKAQLYSSIIPGWGQLYAGYPIKGATSLVLQAGALGFGVYSFWHKYYISGFFTGVGLFNLFYQGGGRYAYKLAEQKNEILTRKYNDKIKYFIIGIETNSAQ